MLRKPRRLIVLNDSETSWDYGYNPNQRPIDELLSMGCVVLDKHRGPTSHEVTSDLKKILNLRKAGHTGTLENNGEIPMCPVFSWYFLRTLQELFHISTHSVKNMLE